MVHLRGAELISPWNSRIDTSWHLAGGWFSSRCDHGWKVTDQMEVLRGFSIAMFDHRRVLGDSRGGYWDMLSDIWGIVLVSSWWCWFWNHVGPHPAFMIKLQAKVWTLKSFKIFFEKISINIHFWKLNWKEISKDLKSSQKYAYTHVCMCIYIYIFVWISLNMLKHIHSFGDFGTCRSRQRGCCLYHGVLQQFGAAWSHGTPWNPKYDDHPLGCWWFLGDTIFKQTKYFFLGHVQKREISARSQFFDHSAASMFEIAHFFAYPKWNEIENLLPAAFTTESTPAITTDSTYFHPLRDPAVPPVPPVPPSGKSSPISVGKSRSSSWKSHPSIHSLDLCTFLNYDLTWWSSNHHSYIDYIDVSGCWPVLFGYTMRRWEEIFKNN